MCVGFLNRQGSVAKEPYLTLMIAGLFSNKALSYCSDSFGKGHFYKTTLSKKSPDNVARLFYKRALHTFC